MAPRKTSIFSIRAFAFACATISVAVGNAMFPDTWSTLACVLMIVVTGLSVTARIASRMGLSQPGGFVSTSSTPSSRIRASVLLPPVSTYKMSLTSSV